MGFNTVPHDGVDGIEVAPVVLSNVATTLLSTKIEYVSLAAQ